MAASVFSSGAGPRVASGCQLNDRTPAAAPARETWFVRSGTPAVGLDPRSHRSPHARPRNGDEMALATLKKRPEYLRVRGGRRYATAGFLLEGRSRSPSTSPATDVAGKDREGNLALESISGPRYGFTITKKLGGAVDRNRIRRRLKAALEAISPDAAKPDFDYVVVARRAALDRPFESLKADFSSALHHIHSSGADRPRKRKRTKA